MATPIYHDLPGMEWRMDYAYYKDGIYTEGHMMVTAGKFIDAALEGEKVVSEIAAKEGWDEYAISDLNVMGYPDTECYDPLF